MRHVFETEGEVWHAWLARDGEGWRLLCDDVSTAVALTLGPDGRGTLTIDGATVPVAAVADGDVVHIQIDGRAYALRYRDPAEYHEVAAQGGAEDVARAPMPGVVLSVAVGPGDAVGRGDVLLTIESMKLQTAIRAGRDGIVDAVHVAPGQTFERDAALLTLRTER
ncbi:acetyl-CoA carboxylase biotin carboxyl carrier protein subunit [Acidisphaera rubrifaciens]|uniref:Acetyl-CoA carboxylase biotin carboxylase subunit n=1 Tax=Acidisphaera rubrifaciens HS-AP3 TaxID=1231350 RepID=A0A0D6P8X3_9PROT|nr:biotin/lipoyl-containing protein [Acidisphaera rubrifaciens]GAN77806.1 acetyl-CoA carboxylase biotin carboxylase subunit [Acidisphaera rubrifaciens HS-AP3]